MYRFEWIEHNDAIVFIWAEKPRKIFPFGTYKMQIIRLQNIVSLLFYQCLFIRLAGDAKHRMVAHWLLWLKHSRALENDNVWFRHMRTCLLNKNSCLSTLNWALYESATIASKNISIFAVYNQNILNNNCVWQRKQWDNSIHNNIVSEWVQNQITMRLVIVYQRWTSNHHNNNTDNNNNSKGEMGLS